MTREHPEMTIRNASKTALPIAALLVVGLYGAADIQFMVNSTP